MVHVPQLRSIPGLKPDGEEVGPDGPVREQRTGVVEPRPQAADGAFLGDGIHGAQGSTGARGEGAANDASARARPSPLRLEVVDTLPGLDALADDWRALSARAPNACTFLGVDWHRGWWHVYGGAGMRPHVVTLRRDDGLVGLMPLYRRRIGPTGVPSLQFMGTGEARGEEVVTEYADALAASGDEGVVGDAMLDHLTGFARWRRVELGCLLRGAVLDEALRRRRWPHVLERPAGLRYRVDLDGGEAAHFARLGPSRVRRIERSRRAAARDGGLVAMSMDADPDAAFARLADLHAERQRRMGRRGAFAAARFARFHRTVAERLLPSGAMALPAWRVGDVPVAALHLYVDAATVHYYQSGFATRNANRWMPLTLAHLEAMRTARARGARWYDLMRGEPPCYKDDFGCETTPMTTVVLAASEAERRVETLGRTARAKVGATLARAGFKRD